MVGVMDLGKFLLTSLSIAARDQDIREARAQAQVASGELSVLEAARQHRIEPMVLGNRIRRFERLQNRSTSGRQRRQKIITSLKTQGKLKELRPGIFQLRDKTSTRVIDTRTPEGSTAFSNAVLGISQPKAIRQVVKRGREALRKKTLRASLDPETQNAIKTFENAGYDVTATSSGQVTVRKNGFGLRISPGRRITSTLGRDLKSPRAPKFDDAF